MWDKDRKQSKGDFSSLCWWRCSVKLLTIKSLWYAVASSLYGFCQFESFLNCSSKSIWIAPYRNSRKLALNSIQTQGKHKGPRERMRLLQIHPKLLWYWCCIPECIFILHRSSSAILCPLIHGLTLLWPRSYFIEMLINIIYWMSAFYVGNYDCTRILSWTETILHF